MWSYLFWSPVIIARVSASLPLACAVNKPTGSTEEVGAKIRNQIRSMPTLREPRNPGRITTLVFVQVFEKEMHELAFTFKCPDKRLTSRFVCHMHLRRVIGDHQPIA